MIVREGYWTKDRCLDEMSSWRFYRKWSFPPVLLPSSTVGQIRDFTPDFIFTNARSPIILQLSLKLKKKNKKILYRIL